MFQKQTRTSEKCKKPIEMVSFKKYNYKILWHSLEVHTRRYCLGASAVDHAGYSDTWDAGGTPRTGERRTDI